MYWGTLLESIVYGPIFSAMELLMKWLPPKKINRFYGYRTRRSMSSQQAWAFANKTSASIFLYFGILLLVLGILVYVVFPEKAHFISLFVMLLWAGIGIYCCERLLKKRFHKNGKPKI